MQIQFYITEPVRKSIENLDTFLVVEGATVAHFCQEVLLKGLHPVGAILKSRVWFYVIPEHRIGVLLTEERDLMKFGDISHLFIPYIKYAKRVLTISVEPSVSYKVEQRAVDQDDACFLRGINTGGIGPKVMDLPTPNLLAGVAAGSWLIYV